MGSQKYQSIETKNYAKNQKDRHQCCTNDVLHIKKQLRKIADKEPFNDCSL